MRIIDADDLIKTIPNTNIVFENCGLCTLLDKEEVIAIINKAPTIEAEPIKHGKWIKQKHEDTDGSTIYGWECSVCGDDGVVWRTDDDIDIEKFCYNCGAKMKGEEE